MYRTVDTDTGVRRHSPVGMILIPPRSPTWILWLLEIQGGRSSPANPKYFSGESYLEKKIPFELYNLKKKLIYGQSSRWPASGFLTLFSKNLTTKKRKLPTFSVG